jgi:hypothetical protein
MTPKHLVLLMCILTLGCSPGDTTALDAAEVSTAAPPAVDTSPIITDAAPASAAATPHPPAPNTLASPTPAPTPPPRWSTCDRYARVVKGEPNAQIDIRTLRTRPTTTGVQFAQPGKFVRPQWGPTRSATATLIIDQSPLRVPAGLKISAWLHLKQRDVVIALLHAPAGALQVMPFRRANSSPWTTTGSPAHLIPSDSVSPTGPRARLGHVGEHVLLQYSALHNPGGCTEFNGTLPTTLVLTWDHLGQLRLRDRAPNKETLNGSNVIEGGVYHFSTRFQDIDGDQHLDLTITPWGATRPMSCSDEVRKVAQPPTHPKDPPIVFHRVFRNHGFVRADRQDSDLLVADYTRALLRTQAGYTSGAMGALDRLTRALETLARLNVSEKPMQAPAVEFYRREYSGVTPNPPHRPDPAHHRELLVGIASLIAHHEAQPATQAAARALRARLQAIGPSICEPAEH